VAECLSILFEDAHCLAVIKAAGQFTQGTWAPPGETTLEADVRAYLDPASPATVYLGIAHRLDRGTSGVLIWAKTPKAARRLSEEFERRLVVKEYWAVVEAAPSTLSPDADLAVRRLLGQTGSEVVWSDWLTAANKAGVVTALDAPATGARSAVTRVRYQPAVALPEGCHWLCLWPETGRTHQLRAQAARRGLPVVGDAAYGSTRAFPQPHAFALHARALRLKHPISGVPLELTAPLPAAWETAGFVLVESEHGSQAEA
jgi:23S rRNA pseudouridine1911/1915/1917 synthase